MSKHQVTRKQRLEPSYPSQNWSAIGVGETVQVLHANKFSYHGTVEAKTADSMILWVVSSGGQGRAMYGHADGVRIFKVGT